jgi:hypothetical protein
MNTLSEMSSSYFLNMLSAYVRNRSFSDSPGQGTGGAVARTGWRLPLVPAVAYATTEGAGAPWQSLRWTWPDPSGASAGMSPAGAPPVTVRSEQDILMDALDDEEREARIALMHADIANKHADTRLKEEQARWEPWKALSAAFAAGIAVASGLIALAGWLLAHVTR